MAGGPRTGPPVALWQFGCYTVDMYSSKHPISLPAVQKRLADESPELKQLFGHSQKGLICLRNRLRIKIASTYVLRPRGDKPYLLRDYLEERGYIARGPRNDLMFNEKGYEVLRDIMLRAIVSSATKAAAEVIEELEDGGASEQSMSKTDYLQQRNNDLERRVKELQIEKKEYQKLLQMALGKPGA